MGKPVERFFENEETLLAFAAETARRWRRNSSSLCVGLSGELGAGKTSWVRGMLSGLGHEGRVPSPTFSLVEPYDLGGLRIVHLDLYRLPEDGDTHRELEDLGVREWVGQPDTWLLVEWPERWPDFAAIADAWIRLSPEATGRLVQLTELC